MRLVQIVARFRLAMLAGGAVVLLSVGGLTCVARAGDAVARPAAASGPHLPEAPSLIGALRRGANGQIEVIDPTKEQGSGRRLCRAGTVCVGEGQPYATLGAALAVARQGDTIEVVGGTYHETDDVTTNGLTIRGIAGRPHFDCAGLRLSGDKACIVISAQKVTLDNLEISGAQIADSLGANGACIRGDPNTTFTVRRIECHDSQDGILSASRSIVVENSEFYDNGWNGQTHNVYFSGDCDSVIVRGSIFRDAHVGHEFKSRCRKTEISDSTFRSTKGSRDLDIPDGGDTLVYRSTLVKTAGAQSDEIVGFTAESCHYPGDMVLKDVRIVDERPDAAIHNFDKCVGHPIVLDHVTIEGPPPREIGYVIKR
ncbi:MAG TPA: right-handed parallel beta-helix repeat-containing protein [Stellaceae bacterium]|nr:right-handed parallel beta-helix repeat-containing protein [Stellaceae bacterium]